MQWKDILNDNRLGKPKPDNDFRSPYQRDFDRIIFCSALRRLQDKTQVFPLAKNDYVRTRLTHSLEVASIGRSIAYNIGFEVGQRDNLSPLFATYLGEIVAAASLAHDIGNPPFGHSGEDAISAWFQNPKHKNILKGLNPNQIAEFQNFEGNAQGFRVLCNLQKHHKGQNRFGGLQLTYATLGAFLKYPRQAFLKQVNKKRISQKKYNFFESEKEDFLDIAKKLNLTKIVENESYARYPLVFLVEAADDIAYTIADLQDGFRLGLVPYQTISNFLLSLLGEKSSIVKAEIEHFINNKDKIEHLAGKAIGKLVIEVSNIFLENEKALLNGEFEQPLTLKIPSYKKLSEMFNYAHENIYTSKEVVELKVAGFSIINSLLDIFIPAILEGIEKDNFNSKRNQLVLKMIPNQFVNDFIHLNSSYEKLHRITDFIAGMTDTYAMKLYQRLNGIAI